MMIGYELRLLLVEEDKSLLSAELFKDDGVLLVEEDGIKFGLLLTENEWALLGSNLVLNMVRKKKIRVW